MNKKIRIGLAALAVSVTAMSGVTDGRGRSAEEEGQDHDRRRGRRLPRLGQEQEVVLPRRAPGHGLQRRDRPGRPQRHHGPRRLLGHRQPRYPHRQLLRQGEGEPRLQGRDVEDGPGPVVAADPRTHERPAASAPGSSRARCSTSASKSSEQELMQYRWPVGFGPSSKTCPRWPPQRVQTTSVRLMNRLLSGRVSTASRVQRVEEARPAGARSRTSCRS